MMNQTTAHLIAVDPTGHIVDYHPCWVTEQPGLGLGLPRFRVDYMQGGKHKTDLIMRKHVVSLRYYG
jgi:hypothetical protein